MRREDFSRFRIELYLLIDTNVNLREVVPVEALAQHLSAAEDIVLLQFLLSAEDIPRSIQLLVLRADGLRFFVALILQLCFLLRKISLLSVQVLNTGIQACHITVESVDGLIEFSNVNILCLQFSTQLFQLTILLYELSLQILNVVFFIWSPLKPVSRSWS